MKERKTKLLNYEKQISLRDSGNNRFTFTLELLLLVFLQQLADELLGQITGVTEELVIKLIVDV